MTWAIAAGVISMLGFLITVGTLGFRLSSVLTRLDVTVKDMQEANKADRKHREAEHREMYDTLDDHEKKLQNHEIRLHDLERSGKNAD